MYLGLFKNSRCLFEYLMRSPLENKWFPIRSHHRRNFCAPDKVIFDSAPADLLVNFGQRLTNVRVESEMIVLNYRFDVVSLCRSPKIAQSDSDPFHYLSFERNFQGIAFEWQRRIKRRQRTFNTKSKTPLKCMSKSACLTELVADSARFFKMWLRI